MLSREGNTDMGLDNWIRGENTRHADNHELSGQ